jgi:hypothetical protein
LANAVAARLGESLPLLKFLSKCIKICYAGRTVSN